MAGFIRSIIPLKITVKEHSMFSFNFYLFFFFLSFFFSFSKSFLAISRISIVSLSEGSIEEENAEAPPKYVDLVEALDKLRRRFSFTASLSSSLALEEGKYIEKKAEEKLKTKNELMKNAIAHSKF